MSKKNIIIGILVLVLALFLFLRNNKSEKEILPNRDFDGVTILTDPVEICTEFTDAQEFDDQERYTQFFEQCLRDVNEL